MHSPYNHAPSYGLVGPNHTSSIQMVYHDGAYPTPWPWVLGSIFLSIILGALSAYTSWKVKQVSNNHITPSYTTTSTEPKLNHKTTFQTFVAAGVIVSAIRAIAALILTCIALHSGTGRLGSPSSMVMLLTSLGISIVNISLSPFFKYLTQLSFILAFITFILTLYSPSSISGSHLESYATLHVIGGNCATPSSPLDYCIQSLNDSSRSYRNGCNGYTFHQGNQYKDYYDNPLRQSEIGLYVIGLIYCVYVLALTPSTLRPLIFPFQILQLFRYCRDSGRKMFEVEVPSWYYTDSKKKQIFYLQMFGLIVAIVVCCVAIPMHITATANSKTVQTYLDGSPNGSAENEAWWDCFSVGPPTDPLGFWEFWWGEGKARVAHVIAVV